MNSTVLSKHVITQIFGLEFTNEMKSMENSTANPGTSSGQSHKSSEEISGGHALHAVTGQHHNADIGQVNHHDGVRPSKSPRTSQPYEIDVGIDQDKTRLFVDTLVELINQKLIKVGEVGKRQLENVNQEGRLGPSVVKYDVGTHVGSFIISNDRLGVNSQCNFGSVRANTCVFKGKWQFEIQLGSKGVMQLGWATVNTKFSQEKGVGDTGDSYAYDGNRLRKWNMSTAPYGESWQTGDIIGCCMDLDDGNIEFHRNGKSMGVAFNNVHKGSGIAYFPAASLAFGENIVSNFGATPLQFPVPGFSPMQLQRTVENAKTDLLLSWLDKVLTMYPNMKFSPDFSSGTKEDYQTLLVITNRIVEFLGPNLHSGFVVEQAFLPFFAKTMGLPEKVTHEDNISMITLSTQKTDLLLDIMWTFLEETEMKNCLERLCIILLNYFRSNTLSLSYPFQHFSLHCLLALAGHRKTRRYLIHHLLFDKTKVMHFLHVRPVDETVLKDIIPDSWWPGKTPDNSFTARAFEAACALIHEHVTRLENAQVLFLKKLLINSDGTEKRPSSRALFLRKLRLHIRDVIRPGSILQQPVNKAMCTFFCLLKTVCVLYAEEVEANDSKQLPDLPSSLFYDTSVNYFDMERVGGLATYLYKAHHTEIAQALSIPDYISTGTGGTIEENDSPMPGVFTVAATPQNGQHLPNTSLSAPAITIAVPRIFPPANLSTTADRLVEATIATPPHVTTQTAIPHITRPRNIDSLPPTQIPNLSATSSGEDVTPIPHIGTYLTGGTINSNGQSMLIPMLTDFRSLLAPGEHGGVTYYPGFLGFSNFEHRMGVQPHNPAVALLGKESGSMDVRASLRELLDDAIIVYSCGVLRHVEKVVALRSVMEEYSKALLLANSNLNATNLSEGERIEILKSIDIFSQKLDEQARHVAWINSAVFTSERQHCVFQLLKTILKTLKTSSAEGPLFTFVPELYVSTVINLTWLLLTQMHPTIPFTNIQGIDSLLVEVSEFVATHFADPRIVIAETKDTLTQALSMFICNRTMLTAVEQMPDSSQVTMVKAILRPYENRAWAQSNWMLVRMWQGNGFGFQYPNSLQARRSFRARPVQDEFGISTNLPPTPSRILQSHVSSVLIANQKFASSYVHSVLNQLNWAFSEFVGLLQEIQNAANRPERVFIESRQLKICCTCYELTQALLRVMEMIVNIAPPIITDFSRDSAEPLLGRLCMLLSQIMNRIGSNTGSFSQVIDLDITGLENVTHYPLLSAVAGILVAVLRGDLENAAESDLVVTKSVLGEPSFQVRSLDFLLGQNQPALPEGKLPFSLRSHVPEDVSEHEIAQLENTIFHLISCSQKMEGDTESIADDDVCTICYAYPKNTTFKPCNHRACKSCIIHHLMNRGECFFCKAIIQQVISDDGAKLHDIHVPAESQSINEDNILVHHH